MRILVLSDTHGDISRVPTILEKLNKEKTLDLIVHLGDYEKDARDISKITRIQVISVKGNCDSSFDEKGYEVLDTEYGSFVLTHGHMEGASYSEEGLFNLANDLGAVGIIYGHTHRKVFTNIRGIYLLNPGSLTKPRDNTSGTFLVLDTFKDSINVNIYDYIDFINDKKKKKMDVKTGHLSSLLNYSDRF